MDADTLLSNTMELRELNETNRQNLLKLGIEVCNLPNHIQSRLIEYVDLMKTTGLHDLNPINLEIWHLNKKIEALALQQDILKPFQKKVRDVTIKIGNEEEKLKLSTESINDIESSTSEEEITAEIEHLNTAIKVAENNLTQMLNSSVTLDCDELINKINILKIGKKK